MAVDRDIGVAFARAQFAEGDHDGWEMLSATGVRALRLLAESGRFRSFVLSEAQPAAVGVLETNARGFPGARVVPGDARRVPVGGPFDYVDIDPYGSPLRFLPTAIAATAEGGVLGVTATDMMVLAGAQPSACERLYGSRPVRGRLGPEGGLRILLAAVARYAGEAGRSIRVLLAYVRDHHVRAYVAVGSGGGTADPVGRIDPEHWDGPPVGEQGPYGPLWLGPLFDTELTPRLTAPNGASEPAAVDRFFERVRAESAVDRPFYYEPNEVAGRLRLRSPPSLGYFARALAQAGYATAPTHARPEGFRTTAPRSVVEGVARQA